MFEPDIKSVTDIVQRLCDEAYAKGFADGGESVRERIMRAASVEVPEATKTAHSHSKVHNEHVVLATFANGLKSRERAPRGSVAQAIAQLLVENPGATQIEMEKIGSVRYPDISPKSFGNELRRFENDRYKRDRFGGYKWFLIEQDVPDDEHGGSKGATTPSAVDDLDFMKER